MKNNINRNRIYKYILEKGPVTISDVIQDLKLSIPTATKHISKLTSRGYLIEDEYDFNTGGRPARLIKCNYQYRYSIGIDIRSDFCIFILMNLIGEVIDYKKIAWSFMCDSKHILDIKENIYEILSAKAVELEEVIGVGISLPAIIDQNGNIIDTIFDFEISNDFITALQAQIGLKIKLFNDANSGGVAEFWHYKHESNIFYLSLNESVGGNIKIGNNIYNGNSNISGEVGHIKIVPDGLKCYCGQRGCVNSYCSSNNLNLNFNEQKNSNLEDFFNCLNQKLETPLKKDHDIGR